MTKIELIVIAMIIIVLLGLAGVYFLIESLYYLTAGWIHFLIRVVPSVSVGVSGILTAPICLISSIVGLQLFLGWLFRAVRNRHGSLEKGAERTWPVRWTLCLVGLTVVLFTAGIGASGFAHQSSWLFREPLTNSRGTHKTASANNLKQIGLAAFNHADTNGRLPAGGIFDDQGRGMYSWQTALLPYIEQEELYKTIDLKSPWDGPKNAPALGKVIPTYQNPAITDKHNDQGFALSHYAANVRLLGPNSTWAMKQITDGTSNTILAGEAFGNFRPWGYPANWRDPAQGINTSPNSFGNPSLKGMRGAQFTFADSSVRFISENVSPTVLKALSTPNGGEVIPDDY
jgi:hypothetical protein